MIPTTCPHGKDPCMCSYCDKKDTCDCRCDKNTDVIWGEITGELKDQTDLQAALDKHTADILTIDTLAHSNEQRLDAVEGTANEANQRSKDNTKRLDQLQDSIDISVTDTNNGDLEFADESGNVVMRLSNGHIKTKNFDSETAQGNANEDIIIIY